MEFDEQEAGQTLIGANRLARQNNWVAVKRTATNILLETLVIHYQYKEHSFL